MSSAVSGDTTELRRRFETVPLFAAMATGPRNDVWAHTRCRSAVAGEMLIAQGAEIARFHVLLSGEATSTRVTGQGRSVTIGRWVAPVVIDKVAMFAESEHPAWVQADTDVSWCVVPAPVLRAAVAANPSAQQHALSQIASAATRSRSAFIDVASRSSTARLARWLLVTSELGVELTIPRPQDRLAQQLGMSRVTLNRGLHRLIAEGLIEFNSPTVTIIDHARLRQSADL